MFVYFQHAQGRALGDEKIAKSSGIRDRNLQSFRSKMADKDRPTCSDCMSGAMNHDGGILNQWTEAKEASVTANPLIAINHYVRLN